MAAEFKVDPISRIEGHMKIECKIEKVLADQYFVTECRAPATMFRGFEIFLRGRDPRDALLITQRICGVCPNPQGMASVQAVEDAFGAYPPPAAILIRNVMEAAYYCYDHPLHFYLLIGLELGVISRHLPMLPPVLGTKGIKERGLGAHYAKFVEIQRRANEVVAIWGGKFPHVQNLYPGGVTVRPTLEKIAKSIVAMVPVWEFVALTHIEDVKKVIEANDNVLKPLTETIFGVPVGLEHIGVCTGDFLCYGIFPDHEDYDDWLDPSRRKKAKIRSGAWSEGEYKAFYEDKIREFVKYSYYTDECTNLHPSEGKTIEYAEKPGAYSWCKAPRYDDKVYEVGPLARMINTFGTKWEIPRIHPITKEDFGPFVYEVRNPRGSVLDRIAARAAFALCCANWFYEFILKLMDYVGEPVLTYKPVPEEGEGRGLWEAPRGALGHWIRIKDHKIDLYQCVVPGTWNWSPRDDEDRPGPGETALQAALPETHGYLNAVWVPTLTVPEIANALYPGWGDELAEALTALHPYYADLNMEPTAAAEKVNATIALLVVRSFDPCLACGVHLIKPDGRTYTVKLEHAH